MPKLSTINMHVTMCHFSTGVAMITGMHPFILLKLTVASVYTARDIKFKIGISQH